MMELERCPLCESPTIRKKRGKRNLQMKDQWVTTPVISYWECSQCGEVFYPQETSKKLDEAFLTGVKRVSR